MNIRSGTCSHGGRRLWTSGGEILFSDFWQIMKMYKYAVLVYIYAKQRLWECRIWDEASDWMEICDFWSYVCMSLIFNSMQICFSASVLPWMFSVDVWYIVPFFLNIYSKNKGFCTKLPQHDFRYWFCINIHLVLYIYAIFQPDYSVFMQFFA